MITLSVQHGKLKVALTFPVNAILAILGILL